MTTTADNEGPGECVILVSAGAPLGILDPDATATMSSELVAQIVRACCPYQEHATVERVIDTELFSSRSAADALVAGIATMHALRHAVAYLLRRIEEVG